MLECRLVPDSLWEALENHSEQNRVCFMELTLHGKVGVNQIIRLIMTYQGDSICSWKSVSFTGINSTALKHKSLCSELSYGSLCQSVKTRVLLVAAEALELSFLALSPLIWFSPAYSTAATLASFSMKTQTLP